MLSNMLFCLDIEILQFIFVELIKKLILHEKALFYIASVLRVVLQCFICTNEFF